MNLPLTRLPFFSSKESATAAGTITHITKTNPNFCTRFILFVLYVPGVVSFVDSACLDNERACWMVALAGNFYIFAPRLTARLAAVLFAVLNIAAAWNVRAFLFLLVYHGNSSDRYCSGFSILWQTRRQTCRRSAPPLSGTLDQIERRTASWLIRAGAVFLCILVAIKIPSGSDKQSGAVELSSQSSEHYRARPSRTTQGHIDSAKAG
jgi:hypothetical protein